MKNKGLVLVYLIIGAYLSLTSCNSGTYPSGLGLDSTLSMSTRQNSFIPFLSYTGFPDWSTTPDFLQYHYIVIDDAGNILPWYNPDNLGDSYDRVLHLVFDWWLNIPPNPNEPDLPFYLMHRIWQPAPGYFTPGIGGDQLAMAMSSWRLYYDYTGDTRAMDDMILMANHVLENGLSSPTDEWPNLPYPYNCDNLGVYNGDLIVGPGYTQPDKAGSFGYELLNLYKITGDNNYLQAAINIANTLAFKTQDGDLYNSPLPYRVSALDGTIAAIYTTNYSSLLMLWEGLEDLGQGDIPSYQTAHTKILTWLRTYPVQNNKWGPFFEDIEGWSDTQINAVTMAMYMMEHPQIWGSSWQQDARNALDWPILEFGNNDWINYGVQVMNEQTAFKQPGNSHTSRQASMELRYAELTGDTTHVQNAVRQLSWATYMVDVDGKNYYMNAGIWLTDGYGDYVRHYLRAMAAAPSLAPDNQDHLLRTSSVVEHITYRPSQISYQTFDAQSQELLRVNTFVPERITAGGEELPRLTHISDLDQQEGYTLGADGDLPSVLRIRHDHASAIIISEITQVTVNPDSLSSMQCANTQMADVLSICNIGDQPLEWSLAEAPTSTLWLTETPVSGTLTSNLCQVVTVTFDSNSVNPGVYTSTLEIETSDPLHPVIVVPIELTVPGAPTNVDYTWNPLLPNLYQNVTFTGQATGLLPLTYSWDFGDSITGTNQIATHAYNTWGAFTVSMTAQQCNISTTVTHALNVTSCWSLLDENFESTFPPTGWVVDNHSLPDGWMRNDQVRMVRPNYAGSIGFSADADVDAFGSGSTMDTELRSVILDLSNVTTATLQYMASYNWFSTGEYANTDISTDGGATWTNLLHWTSDYNPYGPGELVTLDLTQYIGSENTLVRFYYYAPARDYWFQVDQVNILGCYLPNAESNIAITPPSLIQTLLPDQTADQNLNIANEGLDQLHWIIAEGCGTPVSWLSESPLTGTVPAYNNTNVAVTFDATGYNPGTYTANLCITSNDLHNPLVVLPITMTVVPYRVEFNYLDLEDVVHSGEAVYIAGSFNDWNLTAIPLTPNTDFSVFTADVGITDTGNIQYKYVVYTDTLPTGQANWNWLQSNNRQADVSGDISITDYRNIEPGWYVLRWPYNITVPVGIASGNIYGQIWADDLTARPGAPRALMTELGYGTSSDPASWTTWQTMAWDSQVGNNDQYVSTLTFPITGTFSFAIRYRANYGTGNPNDEWIYADRNGGTFDIADAGLAAVIPFEADLSVTKSASSTSVFSGDIITYTLVVSNAGPADSLNVVLVDTLPDAVTFVSASIGCTAENGVVSCSVGTLTSGNHATFIIVVTAPTQMVTLTNTVVVTSNVPDPDINNNTASVDVEVDAYPGTLYSIYIPLVFRLSGGGPP